MPQAVSGSGWSMPGFGVELLPQIDSTNSELMRRARAGRTAPVLLVTERQTAGRGRQGRLWLSEPTSLCFSMGLLLAPPSWSGLSLAVGLAVAQGLHADVKLKWPNDLYLDERGQGRKLGGILVETASLPGQQGAQGGAQAARYVVIGVGINIHPPAEPAALSMPAAALAEIWPDATALGALARVAPLLAEAVRQFGQQGFAPFQAAYQQRDWLRGQTVRTGGADGTQRTGVAQGVDADGALLLHTEGMVCKIIGSEVSVRPAA